MWAVFAKVYGYMSNRTTDQFETSLLVLFRKRINDGMTFKPIYEQLLKAAKGGTNILQSGDAVSQTSQISDIILVKFLRAKDFDVERVCWLVIIGVVLVLE